jgi:hypothetical protein
MPRGDGIVFLRVGTNVVAGTVMNSGQVIFSGLPSWARPSDNVYVSADINGTYCSFNVTPSGEVIFIGPTQTVPGGGSVFPYGQAAYLSA